MRRLIISLIACWPLLSGFGLVHSAVTNIGAPDLCTQESSDGFSVDNLGVNSGCLASANPYPCCSGTGTGTCTGIWVPALGASLHNAEVASPGTGCLWSMDLSDNNIARVDSNSVTACDSQYLSVGNSTSTASANQFACYALPNNAADFGSGFALRMNSQTATSSMYRSVIHITSNTTARWIGADLNTELGTCNTGESFTIGDQFCVYVSGSGTATEYNAWITTTAQGHLTGDPDTWPAPDCCINNDGSVGGLGVTCSTVTGNLSTNNKDTGGYMGLHAIGYLASDASYANYDTFFGGSCE